MTACGGNFYGESLQGAPAAGLRSDAKAPHIFLGAAAPISRDALARRFQMKKTSAPHIHFSAPAPGLRILLLGAGLFLIAPQGAASAAPASPTPAASAKSGHESPGHISKFEARRIRHACRDRANDGGLRGGDREAFLTKCFFGRASHRGLRKECAQHGEAKGLDKAALREFVRDCVKERSRQKD